MEQIILSDVILTANGLDKLRMRNWGRSFLYSEENYMFWKNLWINPETLDIYESYTPKTEVAIVSFSTNIFLKILDMHFSWKSTGMRINEDTDLGELLSAYILLQFERVGYRSFEKDIKFKNIYDYKYCNNYILERCQFYGIDLPDTPIYLMAADLWDELMGETHAAFYPGYNVIIAPDIKWSSKNWSDSLLVHEFTHAIQRKKGWLLSLKDIKLSNLDVDTAEALLDKGFTIDRIADIMQLDIDILKRLFGILDRKKSYITNYFEMPLEVLAFTEQFKFLQWLGIPASKVSDHVISYMESLEFSLPSRNKGLFERMIQESDKIISQIVAEQEVFNDNPLPSRNETTATDTS